MSDLIEVDDFLAHFGIPGMKWGKRKSRDAGGGKSEHKQMTPEQKAKLKKAAIIVGTAAAVTVLAVGAVYVSKRMNKPVPKEYAPSSKTKAFVDDRLPNQTGVVHASRGLHKGFTFQKNGGLSDPLSEYDRAGFNANAGDKGYFKRYGDRDEKVAGRFMDPEGRKDHAGRIIPHEVILPESLAKGVNNIDDLTSRVWPLIKDSYAENYEKSKDKGY